MLNSLQNISKIAETIKESDARLDVDVCKMSILFPLVEILGYDATQTGDILLNPAYTDDGEYKVDYGLRGEEEDTVKTVIKVIEYEAEPGLEFANIRRALMYLPNVEYVVITDCFNYYIYANSTDGTFIDVVSFELDKITNDEAKLLQLLNNPSSAMKQEFAIDRFDDMDDDDSDIDNPDTSESTENNKKHRKSKKGPSEI